jgi:hypothetical protein
VSAPRCGVLAAWTATWLAGRAASDEVLRATRAGDEGHRIVADDGADIPLSEALIQWRSRGGPVRAVLPVPGDLRGVPGPSGFRAAALEAGEAVFGGGFGLVPEIMAANPASSARPYVRWRAFDVEPPPPDHIDVGEAQHELTAAIRDTARALLAADVSGASGEVGEALAEARRAGERLDLPDGYPARAVALLAQAERMDGVLRIALLDPVGGAIDGMGVVARTEALRPLVTAVRRARVAGYNAGG